MVPTIPRQKRKGQRQGRKGASSSSRMQWSFLAAVCSYSAPDLRRR